MLTRRFGTSRPRDPHGGRDIRRGETVVVLDGMNRVARIVPFQSQETILPVRGPLQPLRDGQVPAAPEASDRQSPRPPRGVPGPPVIAYLAIPRSC